MGKTNYKTCPVCGRSLPANRKFFKRHSDETLHDVCKFCEDSEKRRAEWKGDLLRCHICGKFLPVSEFAKHPAYPYRDGHDARCSKCRTRQSNDTKKKFSEEKALTHILQMRFLCAKERAKKKNLPFDLTKKYLKELWDRQNGKCAVSGIEMTYSLCEGRTPTNVSIDQINPNNGYTKGNIQLVCMAVNQIKSDLQMDDVYRFCKAILENKERDEKANN